MAQNAVRPATRMSRDELETACLRDRLTYGITYVSLTRSQKWEVRPWLIEPYQAVNPYEIEKSPVGLARKLVVQKSTQCGLSTLAITAMFHLADFWPLSIIYMLPRDDDVIDFTGTRIDPMITQSPRLAKLLGSPNSSHTKSFGHSYMYFLGATVEPRMIPADVLFSDEVDLCDQGNLSTAQNRMDASSWKLQFDFSTPTVSNYGINARYLNSDKREWMIRCPHCGEWQILDWNQSLRIEGPLNNPTRVYYGCVKCYREIKQDTVNQGQWVAEFPSRSVDVLGFHISQMYYYPAATLYQIFRDPQTRMVEFYRKRLGTPYELGGGSLEKDTFLVNCFDEPYDEEEAADGKSRYYMGVDQGNQLQVIIAKVPPDNERPRVVHAELVPFDVGFDRLDYLMRLYRIRRCVGDANPNRHSMAERQKRFPGRFILADYAEQRTRLKIVREPKKRTILSVSIQRTEAFDQLFDHVRKGMWQLPGTALNISDTMELVIDHMTALRRDVEMRKTPGGEIAVGVYRSIRADHFAHCWLYLQTAIELDKAAGGQVRVTEAKAEPEIEEEPVKELDIPEDEIKEIVAIIAEVPQVDLAEYVVKHTAPDYIPPFPLSFKLTCLPEGYEVDRLCKVIGIFLEREENARKRKARQNN